MKIGIRGKGVVMLPRPLMMNSRRSWTMQQLSLVKVLPSVFGQMARSDVSCHPALPSPTFA